MNISLKDYAKKCNVSYEAIRQQVKRYENDLNGHIIKLNNTKLLDDFAQEFLDQKRKTNPVIVYEIEKDEQIEQLKAEKEALLLQLLEKSNEIDKLKNEKINYIEQKLVLEYKEKEMKQLESQLEEYKKDKDQLKQELTELKNKSIFYKIFRK